MWTVDLSTKWSFDQTIFLLRLLFVLSVPLPQYIWAINGSAGRNHLGPKIMVWFPNPLAAGKADGDLSTKSRFPSYYNSWTPLPCTWTEKVDIGQPCWTISLFSNHSTSATSVHELVCQVVEHLGPKSGAGIRSKRTANARHCCCCFLCPWPWAEHVWGHRAANMINQRQQCRCARKI